MSGKIVDQNSSPSAPADKAQPPWQRPEFEVMDIDRHTMASYLVGTDGGGFPTQS